MSRPQLALRAEAYRIPTDAPEADGTFAWSATTLVVVWASVDGITGLGYTYGPVGIAAAVGELLAPCLAGIDPDDVPAAWLAMRRGVRNAGWPGLLAMSLSAVDCALWDLKARRHGMPLARLLGCAREAVAVYGSGGFTTYDAQRQRAQLSRWVFDEGIPRVKIKIGESDGSAPDRDVARIRAARRAIGPAELYVDANGGYSRKQAVRVLRRVADADVRWFEEPVSSDDLAGLDQVRAAVDADVAAGEYGYDLTYFARMVPHVDCLQIDVTRCGGITEFQRAAALAAGAGVPVSAHCAPHQHLAVALATPNLRHIEWFHDHVRIERMLLDGARTATGGQLSPDLSADGNGLTLKYAEAQRWRVA